LSAVTPALRCAGTDSEAINDIVLARTQRGEGVQTLRTTLKFHAQNFSVPNRKKVKQKNVKKTKQKEPFPVMSINKLMK
jgi:CxxC motif-containing protein (DUF1111 family)